MQDQPTSSLLARLFRLRRLRGDDLRRRLRALDRGAVRVLRAAEVDERQDRRDRRADDAEQDARPGARDSSFEIGLTFGAAK